MTPLFSAAITAASVAFQLPAPGSGGLIGQTLVADVPPDGYTLLFAGGSMTGSRVVNVNFKWDVVRDFSQVSQLTKGKFFLVAQPNLAARNVNEFIALAHSNPGKLTYVPPESCKAPGEGLLPTFKIPSRPLKNLSGVSPMTSSKTASWQDS